MPKGNISMAAQGNFLETLNMSLNCKSPHAHRKKKKNEKKTTVEWELVLGFYLVN